MKRLTNAPTLGLSALSSVVLLLGCETGSDTLPSGPERGMAVHLSSFARSDWSEPVNIGAPVNSPFNEQNATLSKDGLSLYFTSSRPDGFGVLDIWVAQRATLESPWEAPVNLRPTINGPLADFAPSLSSDGHLLFFASVRPGGQGGPDIYVSHRVDAKDDFSWGPPVNLGPDVNTTDFEQAPEYVQNAEGVPALLYFNRGALGLSAADIYAAPMTRDGQILGPAVLVAELSDPTANDAAATVSTDGLEALFFSSRTGGLGGTDLWVSARRSIHDPWSPPLNPGAPLNSEFGDVTPNLSFDGRTLLFGSRRPGGLGGNDLWMSKQTTSGH